MRVCVCVSVCLCACLKSILRQSERKENAGETTPAAWILGIQVSFFQGDNFLQNDECSDFNPDAAGRFSRWKELQPASKSFVPEYE